MSKRLKACFVAAIALLSMTMYAATTGPFLPGGRTVLLAHNSYPTKDQSADPLDRAISSGMPLMVEIDLAWVANPKTGKKESLIAGSPKNVTGDEPTLKSYLFEHLRPVVEKALKADDRKSWPLISVYLDVKDDAPEHLQAIWAQTGEYENWLTTAVKTNDASKQSPLNLKPLMLFVDDARPVRGIKEEYFYNKLPVGGKLRIFGSAMLTLPPGSEGLSSGKIFEAQAKMKVEDLLKEPASNYHRWWAQPHWDLMVEQAPMESAGQWTAEKEMRLKALVSRAHKLGYFVSLYNLNGSEPGKGPKEDNFGSLEAVTTRWQAAARAGTDFITSDQYEEASKVIRQGK